jgi:hypothetical protein
VSNLINLELHGFMKVTSAELAVHAETLRHELVLIQSMDISELNGRELRKLRDRLLHIKWLLVVPRRGSR